MRDVNYFLWLQKALGPGAHNTRDIFEVYSSPKEIYRATDTERRVSGVFTSSQIDRLSATDIEKTYEIIRDCGALGVDILTFQDDDYPKLLSETADFPVVLYVKGDISAVNRKIPLAIVGTREPAPRSPAAASKLSRAVSECGFVVVSGGALGVDAAAHTGALLVGEPTVAVLGCGHGSKYLKENRPLRDVITTCGATVTEYPPLTDSNKGYFPVRNRLISGMSVGTVVIEAKDKSGSLITARHATEQSRDIFAMPALELGSSSIGCDRLIEDGAKAVYCPFDVIEQYLGSFPEKITINESVNLFEDLTCPENGTVLEDSEEINRRHELLEEERRNKGRPEKREITDPLTDEAIRVYAAFERDPLSIKQLAESVIMPTSSLLGALTELELYGYIELLPDTNYSIK